MKSESAFSLADKGAKKKLSKKKAPREDFAHCGGRSGASRDFAHCGQALGREQGLRPRRSGARARAGISPTAVRRSGANRDFARGGQALGRERGFRPLRWATEATRLGWRRLLKKAGENF
ncbi:MAG: hypothetical protein ACI4QZ_05960 [Eubacteriales bacterium]